MSCVIVVGSAGGSHPHPVLDRLSNRALVLTHDAHSPRFPPIGAPQNMDDEVVDRYERWLWSAKSLHGPSHPAVSFASSSLAGVLLEQVRPTLCTNPCALGIAHTAAVKSTLTRGNSWHVDDSKRTRAPG